MKSKLLYGLGIFLTLVGLLLVVGSVGALEQETLTFWQTLVAMATGTVLVAIGAITANNSEEYKED